MPSLMERIRAWLSLPDHGDEHADIQRRLDQQRIALARLDAYVRARRGGERRQQMTPRHPGRRATDA